jgi:hypothetical protein
LICHKLLRIKCKGGIYVKPKLFIALFICFTILALAYCIANEKLTFFESKSQKEVETTIAKGDVLKQKEKYITVGSNGCEFRTIKEALKAVNTSRRIIYLMDKVLTECNIKINEDVEIRGFGTGKTIVQAAANVSAAQDRVFLIEKKAKVVMNGFTIQHGKVTKVPRCGAGIYNLGKLVLRECVICNNLATYGVGIDNRGMLDMKDSVISGNRSLKRPLKDEASGVDCGGSGCGIKIQKNSVATLSECLIMDNVSVANGGGIHISCEGRAALINCTIVNNKCNGEGGGISVRGDLEITNCTITKNTAHKGDGIYVMGGKIYMSGNIIAGNEYTDLEIGSGYGFYENGSVEKNEFNLIQVSSVKSLLSVDPKLSALGNNGGPTMTCALKSDSPAINMIPAGKLKTKIDQRGIDRVNGPLDIGAYEYVK